MSIKCPFIVLSINCPCHQFAFIHTSRPVRIFDQLGQKHTSRSNGNRSVDTAPIFRTFGDQSDPLPPHPSLIFSRNKEKGNLTNRPVDYMTLHRCRYGRLKMTNLGASAQRHDVQVRKDPEKELLGQFPVNQGFVGLGKDPACML